MGASIDISSYEIPIDTKTIHGLPCRLRDLPEVLPVDGQDGDGPYQEIPVPGDFPPGSILLFSTQIEGLDSTLDDFCKDGVVNAFSGLDLVDLNTVLFRCDEEERDASGAHCLTLMEVLLMQLGGKLGSYEIPSHGKLVYCGLQGWMAPLRHVMQYNDLGHPLCGHLRDGTWAMDYISGRLEKYVFSFGRNMTLISLADKSVHFLTLPLQQNGLPQSSKR